MAQAIDFVEAKLQKFGIDISQIELDAVFVELGIDKNTELDTADGLKSAQICLASLLPELLMQANVTEGGYSVSWNIQGIKDYIGFLNAKLGITTTVGTPTVIDKTCLW